MSSRHPVVAISHLDEGEYQSANWSYNEDVPGHENWVNRPLEAIPDWSPHFYSSSDAVTGSAS